MEKQNHLSAKNVHLISLGCARNRVDSEVMLGSLVADGWQVVDQAEQAEAIVVNTCGFIGPAKEESVDTILEAASLKKQKPELRVVVTGCLTQRYKAQLASGLPEVDLFIGTDEFPKIADLIKTVRSPATSEASVTSRVEAQEDAKNEADQPESRIFAKRSHYIYDESLPRVNTLAKHSAYVKVAEGCQHSCAFCIIPAIRGKLRSRPIPNVVSEVEGLVADGVKEVNLIAQDLAAYGRDRPTGPENLMSLLEHLVGVEGLQWLRMLYLYPENVTEEFLRLLAREERLVKYLDIPVQHASDKILTSMRRAIDRKGLTEVFAKVRSFVPDIALRTTVLVGFPGETEADFDELLEFIEEQRFAHLGCFPYSREEGTLAARLPGHLPEDVKLERVERVMTLQQRLSQENLSKMVGQTLDVLVEGPSQDSEWVWQGRLSTQAPEIDGVVYLTDGPVAPGKIQKVYIEETHSYDLVGEVVSP